MKRKGVYIWQKSHTKWRYHLKWKDSSLGVTALWDTVPNSTAHETAREF